MTTVTDPHSLYEVFDTGYSEGPYTNRDGNDSVDGAAAGTAEPVRTRINAVEADAMFRINAYSQRQVSGNNT